MKYLLFFFTICFFLGCKSGSRDSSQDSVRHLMEEQRPNTDVNSENNHHVDPNYKYEFRTGESDDYSYNYDINGYDSEGNFCEGNIDISGKYGSGYITDESGNEKYVDVEWVDWGVMEGIDEDGNTYEFEVDQ